jgi:hypothetical protein
MSNRNIKNNIHIIIGWAIAALGTAVYLLTLEPTVSFWDCGEFIATSQGLQIGHPPGAPLYQLLAHCFMLFAGGNPQTVAWWSNALSAVAGGLTAMFLFWTLLRIINTLGNKAPRWKRIVAATSGALCYLFCDTAWFSAVESEVYSLSMLFSSAIVWATIRWWQSDEEDGSTRWLMLIALLAGLSVGVHQLSLLTMPMVALVYVFKRHERRTRETSESDSDTSIRSSRVIPLVKHIALLLAFFAIGLTPYLILPIRAAADPPINQGNPSSWTAFKSYISRDQYEKAPLLYGRCFNSPIVAFKKGRPVYAKEMDMLFPRMWKQHANAELYYTDWTGRHGRMVEVDGKEYYKPSFGDNLVIFGGYQLGYMYLRYLMWNFSGRYDDRQGFGNLQKGQFITGIPFVDRLYVGTAAKLPQSLQNAGHNRYFLLPLIMGIIGIVALARRNKRIFWMLTTLFLTSSVLLSIYLNHPVYEPRERDYAYVLSFYAFAVWIGIGAYAMLVKVFKRKWMQHLVKPLLPVIVIGTPLLMAAQNWDDHDRSGRYIAHDAAANLLNSCDKDAILFTVGDNDTFPLWYMQQVEGFRTDVQIVNLSLLGSDNYCESVRKQFLQQGSNIIVGDDWRQTGPYRRMKMIMENNCGQRPVYFSHYAANGHKSTFGTRLQLSGMAYCLCDTVPSDSIDLKASYCLMTSRLKWHPLENVYIDETSLSFLRQYWDDALLVAEKLAKSGRQNKGKDVLDVTYSYIPLSIMKSPHLFYRASKAYALCGDSVRSDAMMSQAHRILYQQLEYYFTMPAHMRKYIPYTVSPLMALQDSIAIQNK